ncbi:phage portal protein [Acuticoccus sediminis]|uniref:Phage portal protein n=1 Tax=Acuticoccus sediminis TaxID=2184697 RepID=A0A8B2NM06_9HYPH|nr:phage portal protein [Acuticoccus sediminis]RAH97626.1 phage portal protein [Acuticoccus sediminis]
MFGLDWLFTTSTNTGIAVTPTNAAKCAMVAVCTALLANGCSIPVKLYQRVDGAKEAATDHPAHTLVHRDASDWMSAAAFRTALTRDAIAFGNGFAHITRDGSGRPVELIRLSPGAVAIEIDDVTLEPTYRLSLAHGGTVVEHFSNILHITSGMRADDGVTGLSVISQAKDDIALSLVMAQTVASTFKNNSRPGGIILLQKAMGDDTRAAIKSSWTQALSGENAGGIAVLEHGAKYETIQQPLAENEAEKLLIQTNVAICRHFNVPPHLAYELTRATWSNAAEMNRAFLDYSLAPWHREWVSAYRRALLTPEERDTFLFEFETDEFIKSATLDRWQAYQIARSSGVLTANEIRAIENMPRIDTADADALGNPYTQGNSNDFSEVQE